MNWFSFKPESSIISGPIRIVGIAHSVFFAKDIEALEYTPIYTVHIYRDGMGSTRSFGLNNRSWKKAKGAFSVAILTRSGAS